MGVKNSKTQIVIQPEPNIDKDIGDETLLSIACKSRNIHNVQYLIEHNVNLNKPNRRNEYAINIVICQRNIEILDLLLNNGADLNVIGSDHYPLYTVIILMNRQYSNENEFNRLFDMFKLLIKHGADPNIKIKSVLGKTILDILMVEWRIMNYRDSNKSPIDVIMYLMDNDLLINKVNMDQLMKNTKFANHYFNKQKSLLIEQESKS